MKNIDNLFYASLAVTWFSWFSWFSWLLTFFGFTGNQPRQQVWLKLHNKHGRVKWNIYSTYET
jgi:hypothetical protein